MQRIERTGVCPSSSPRHTEATSEIKYSCCDQKMPTSYCNCTLLHHQVQFTADTSRLSRRRGWVEKQKLMACLVEGHFSICIPSPSDPRNRCVFSCHYYDSNLHESQPFRPGSKVLNESTCSWYGASRLDSTSANNNHE